MKVLSIAALTSQLLMAQAFDQTQFEHIGKMAEFEKDKVASIFDPDLFIEKWMSVVSLFRNDKDHQNKVWVKHEKEGVFKSGEGTASEIAQRRK